MSYTKKTNSLIFSMSNRSIMELYKQVEYIQMYTWVLFRNFYNFYHSFSYFFKKCAPKHISPIKWDSIGVLVKTKHEEGPHFFVYNLCVFHAWHLNYSFGVLVPVEIQNTWHLNFDIFVFSNFEFMCTKWGNKHAAIMPS